ncbi:thiamine phosphate synthase [Mucilaginibacter aquariorum]|uniref:Thiamine phosphate synthase n=1 Tax=Mucilaginibacter aquariorum TaxID=2967225 RepID=A0ABT1SVH2_9SPHI|nr:thiamine phosphate synthase [Mucilaginibacter aquariorum]MCQ6956336.1 thiamine phosphate synthase [Mucilaginibacter aquariorum]
MRDNLQITGGVYLVVDPAMDRALLLSKLALALKAGIDAVQLWNNWLPEADKRSCVAAVSSLCRAYSVPLLIDNDWELLLGSPELDGVHFDAIPPNYAEIQNRVARPLLAGITCSGDLEAVRWADKNGLDYVSFCAMFPSTSAGNCAVVMPSLVREAREITTIPLFVSGGITPENILTLRKLTPFDGVAVISGIMGADDPFSKVKLYQDALNLPTHHL